MIEIGALEINIRRDVRFTFHVWSMLEHGYIRIAFLEVIW